MTDANWIFLVVLSYVIAIGYISMIAYWYRTVWQTRAVKKLSRADKVFLVAYGSLVAIGIILGTVSLICFFVF